MEQSVDKFALIKYEDSNNNGLIDKIFYDLDGDKIFEDSVSFAALGLRDTQPLFSTESIPIGKGQEKFKGIVNNIWLRAQQAITFAEKEGISTDWYNFYKKPLSLHQKYEYGYWLNFYIYHDLRDYYKAIGNIQKLKQLDKAFYSGNWQFIN